MADLIRTARMEQGISQVALAARAGISRTLLIRIEHADAGCAIGTVFEVAAILNIPLFGLDAARLSNEAVRTADRLRLLPNVYRPRTVDDDF